MSDPGGTISREGEVLTKRCFLEGPCAVHKNLLVGSKDRRIHRRQTSHRQTWPRKKEYIVPGTSKGETLVAERNERQRTRAGDNLSTLFAIFRFRFRRLKKPSDLSK